MIIIQAYKFKKKAFVADLYFNENFQINNDLKSANIERINNSSESIDIPKYVDKIVIKTENPINIEEDSNFCSDNDINNCQSYNSEVIEDDGTNYSEDNICTEKDSNSWSEDVILLQKFKEIINEHSNFHNNEEQYENNTVSNDRIKCALCGQDFYKIKVLINHVKKDHEDFWSELQISKETSIKKGKCVFVYTKLKNK